MPGDEQHLRPASHGHHRDLLHVTAGELTLTVDGDAYTVSRPGRSASFEAARPARATATTARKPWR